MSGTAISVAGLGKEYNLGLTHAGSIRELTNRLFGRKQSDRHSEDKSEDTTSNVSNKASFWALKDIDFEVDQGEILGVIGGNGAGKSTLLKILSRITHPTRGQAVVRGSVGSLLEVGTGFHPELTGRENVFLNGSLLGMRRREVRKLFDEIVGFAGVEKFIDTPVKRYSTGMRVRLGFAVAAHLNPQVLIIDEVLAVGDADFQRRCLGKMDEIAHTGRTVFFVSHNMSSIKSLCTRALLLRSGRLVLDGDPSLVIHEHLTSQGDRTKETANGLSQSGISLNDVQLRNPEGAPINWIYTGDPLQLQLSFELPEPSRQFHFLCRFYRQDGVLAATITSRETACPRLESPGHYEVVIDVQGCPFIAGNFTCEIEFRDVIDTNAVQAVFEKVLAFTVEPTIQPGVNHAYNTAHGILALESRLTVNKTNSPSRN